MVRPALDERFCGVRRWQSPVAAADLDPVSHLSKKEVAKQDRSLGPDKQSLRIAVLTSDMSVGQSSPVGRAAAFRINPVWAC